jgi:hypothetical protein
VYFQVLADPITEFKNVTVKEIIKHITTKYPPEPEEVTAVEATLREQWDPTNHIENPFQAVNRTPAIRNFSRLLKKISLVK